MSITALLSVFGIMFILELPDKTMIATIVMATKARARNVALGASLGFVTQMALAVAAGSLMTLLPSHVKALIIGLLFLGGAAYLLLVRESDEATAGEAEGAHERAGSNLREILTAWSVIFIGEFGDLTQIQAANFAAKFHQPVGVFLAGSAALVLVACLGAFGGQWLQRYVPLAKIRFAGGLIFFVLGVITLYGLRHW